MSGSPRDVAIEPPAPTADGRARPGAALAVDDRPETALTPAAGFRQATEDPGSEPSSLTSRLADRHAERVAARRRLTRVRVAAVAAIACLAAATAYVVVGSPLLALRADEVQITGTGTVVDPAAVAATLDGVAGTPLARIDVGGLEAAIGALSGVRSVDVTRAWPHGLAVSIAAREPVAIVPTDGQFAVLDSDGIQVGLVAQPPGGLPLVTVPLGEQTKPALDAVLAVLGALPPELLAEISKAGADSADTVSLSLVDGARVAWGSAQDPELKARVLQVLRQRPAALYDVSAPTMPVTR